MQKSLNLLARLGYLQFSRGFIDQFNLKLSTSKLLSISLYPLIIDWVMLLNQSLT